MSGINNDKQFHLPVSNAGQSKKGPQPEADALGVVEQAVVRHESKSPDVIFAGLSQSGSNAQLGVLAQRLEVGFKNFPSPDEFNKLVKGFSKDELNHPVFASIISETIANQLVGTPQSA